MFRTHIPSEIQRTKEENIGRIFNQRFVLKYPIAHPSG